MIDVKSLKTVFGDRVLIKKLTLAEKKKGLWMPESAQKQKKSGGKIWFGEIAAFGLDSYSQESYGLSIGDFVGIEPMGHHYKEFSDEQGNVFVWLPEEHLALADNGTITSWQSVNHNPKGVVEFRVLGARALLRPEVEEEKKNGIVIPHSAQGAPRIGELLMAGSGEYVRGELNEWSSPEIGSRLLFIEDSESASIVDIVEPSLIVARREDLIAQFKEAAYVGPC